MFPNPGNWFPDLLFANILGILVILFALLDNVLPRVLARQRSGSPARVGDRRSFEFIYLATLLSFSVGIIFRAWDWGVAVGALQYVGLVLILPGLVIRSWAILTLGPFFTPKVTIEKGQRLVTAGPYRWLRHPAYTGMLLLYTGINLALGTWLGAVAGLGLVLAATVYRIAIEEQALLEAFGEEYRGYMQRTWRLLPGW